MGVWLIVGLLSGLVAHPVSTTAQIQSAQPLPRPDYYRVFGSLYLMGEYETAAKQMRAMSKTAYRDINGYFLDSVCYWTIFGESLYHVGEYSQALEQYEAALMLYLDFQAWPSRTRFPNSIQTDSAGLRAAQNVPWATTTRRFTVGKLNDSMLVLMGKSDQENEAVLRGAGGAIDPARWRSIDLAEVMRCVALALHRRREIKGPTCKYDPLTKRLATELASGGDDSIAGAWRGVAKGIAQSSLEDWTTATAMLRSSLQCSGNFDHPLTPIALLELGWIAEQNQQWEAAQQMYLEASISAAAYDQYDVIEEALRSAANVFGAARNGQIFPALEPAIAWADKQRAKPLEASLLVQAALASGEAGDANTAERLLDQARRKVSRNDLRQSDVMKRWFYVSAMAHYLSNDVNRGDAAMEDFVKQSRKTSRRLFQVGFADSVVRSNAATQRDQELLYDAVLREPVETDWLVNPIETMAFQVTPHFEPMERWFVIAHDRDAKDKAINIAELVRRQRFFSTLPFGGRLMALRWLLEAPPEALSDQAEQQKQQLVIRYPAYQDMVQQAAQLREQLEQLPVVPDDKSDDFTQQKKLLDQLGEVIIAQETFLRKIALQREAFDLVFPPLLGMTDVQQRLNERQLIVSLLKIGSRYYVINLGANRYAIDKPIESRNLEREINNLIKQIGVADKAAIYDVDIFQKQDWRETARELTRLIFASADPQSVGSLEEIIFVPDGRAWYLPMELLQYGTAEASVNLNEKLKIRYAPLVSLAVPDERVNRRFRRSAVVAKRNFIRDDDSLIERGWEQLKTELPDVVRINQPLVGPSSLMSATIDLLLVWHDTKDVGRDGPYALAPLQVDQGRFGADLASWMMLPWRGVEQLVLSGYSSNIEGSTRNRANGDELFLTTCSLMSTGTRTILISRWRVGGQSTIDLTREFVTQLDDQSPADAWKRSVDLLQQSELNLDLESRVRQTTLDAPMKADHPFFWSGYMLIDSGAPTDVPAETTDESDDPSEPDQ